MPTYLMLSSLTAQGVQTLKANPDRLREVNRDVEELGAKVLHQWATLGPFDFVNVVEPPVGPRDRRRFLGGFDASGGRRPARRGVEERELLAAPAEHRDAECLQELGGRRYVEEGLDPRGDDERLGAGELGEVGGDVR